MDVINPASEQVVAACSARLQGPVEVAVVAAAALPGLEQT